MYKKAYIWLVVILGGVLPAHGQVVPWTVVPTTVTQEIVLEKADSTANYDYEFDTNGDAIGFFFDQGGTWVCGGYIILDGVSKKFTIYGNDGGDNGFQTGESYHIKYWRKQQNCVISDPVTGMSNAQFTENGSDTINVLGAWPAIVEFPKSFYCSKAGVLPIPLNVSGTTLANISFLMQPQVLAGFNPVTGQIENYDNADLNVNYTFSMTTMDNMCLRYKSISLVIGDKLSINPTVTIQQPTCATQQGSLEVDTNTITQGGKPFIYGLTHISTGENWNYSTNKINYLSSGEYIFLIKEVQGCLFTDTLIIQALPENCDNIPSILTPGQQNGYSEVNFTETGDIKIYSSDGLLVRELKSPAVWDGTNQQGVILKTGLYIIFKDDKKIKEITVVY